ncbi:MAG: TetR/AcrR family transcriptional regulator [Rubrobacteraceae bacterium]
MEGRNRHALRTRATRAALIGSARRLFTERGVSGVSAEELVEDAGMTRGALYHHFGGKGELGGKEGLFAALYEEVQKEVSMKIRVAAGEWRDPGSALRAGCHAFLDACGDPTVRRVMLLDAPAVLGWEHWREVDARYGLGLLKEGLREAMEEGAIREQPVDPIAHLLLGAMNEAAMWIARSEEPEVALGQAGEALDELLEGLQNPLQ